jgi:hypothetical protein
MDLELIEKQLKEAISIVQEMKCRQNEKTETLKTFKVPKELSVLRTLLIDVLHTLECDSETDDDDDDIDTDYDSDDSDASFTREESTYIKNESHREYLKRYSLKPQFPLHYYNADRDK